jgi:hypothetical protein
VATDGPITLSAEQTVNSRALLVGDRVLVKDQADPIENGVYVVQTSAWTRAGDMDGDRDIVGGTLVPAYRVSDGLFPHYIIGGNGASLSPGTDALNFNLFYDPAMGTTIPASSQASSILRGDGAAGWVEETDLTIDASGNLSTTGSIASSDGVESVSFATASAIMTITGSGSFDHVRSLVDIRQDALFYVLNRAAAGADLAGYGQFWVRTSDGAPMYTDPASVDYQLNTAPSFTPPLVLLDDEQIQFGTAAPDVTMEFDSAINGILVDPVNINVPFAFNNAMDVRFHNQIGTGLLSFNDLEITASGGTSNISVPFGIAINIEDNRFIRPVLDDYAIQHQTAGSVSNVLDIDFEDGNSAYVALTENVTTMTLSNPPASGRLGQLEIEILQDSVARTIAWPASVKWPGGTAPDISTTNSTHLVHLRTRDGGTTYLGTYLENFS